MTASSSISSADYWATTAERLLDVFGRVLEPHGFQKTDQARSRDANDSSESSAITTEKRHERSIQ